MDPLTTLEADTGHDAVRSAIDALDRPGVGERRAGLFGGRGEALGDLVHAAGRERDAGDGVHVGDDAEDRERVERRQSRVEGLEGEDPLEPLVVEERRDLRRQTTQGAQAHQPDQVEGPAGEIQGRVEVAVDERPELGVIEVA